MEQDQTEAISTGRFGRLWRYADFMKLWAGQAISDVGSHITRDGLPLLAVMTLGATTFQMGLLEAVAAVPALLASLAAGVWVDRLRRRPLMIAADAGRALVLLAIPLLAIMGRLHVNQLYVIAAAAAVLTVFFDTAYQAYIPTLVERENILEANSKLALSASVAELLGPGLTGVLVQALTAPFAILIDSLSFIASILSIAVIRKPEPPPVPLHERLPAARELADGLRYVFENPVLRALAAAHASLTFFGNFIGPLYALFAVRYLGFTPAALGLTIACGGAGSLIGSLLAERAVRRFGLGRTMAGSLFIGIGTVLMIPLAHGSLPLALAFLMGSQLFGDCFRTIFYINLISLRQSITPDRMLGRATASMELLAAGLGPIGALLGGFLGGVIGVRLTLATAATGGLLALLWVILSPVRGLKSR